MITRILISLLLALTSFQTRAVDAPRVDDEPHSIYDTSWYLGAAFGQMSYQQSNLNDFSLNEQRLIIGKQLNRMFALEMHVGKTSNDTQTVSGVPVTLNVDNYVSGFVKVNATYTFEDWGYSRLRLYALLGGTRLQATTTDPVISSNGTQSSFSGGVGLELFYDNIGVQLGYTRYVNGNSNNHDYSLNSMYLGVIYQFGSNQVDNAK